MENKKTIFKNRKTLSLLALVLALSIATFSLMLLKRTTNASAASATPNYDAYTSTDTYLVKNTEGRSNVL